MRQFLATIEEAGAIIAARQPVLLAGDEQALLKLPTGNWIGGTIPYFMAAEGGTFAQDRVFVTELPDDVSDSHISVYDVASLPSVYADLSDYGFGVIILPAASEVHLKFSTEAPNYADFAVRPLIGWVSGVGLNDLGKVSPKVVDGRSLSTHENAAVVLRAKLRADRAAEIGIINLFKQGAGDGLQFPEGGFTVKDVLVNGARTNFAEYLKANQVDTRLPLVADYAGAMVNISFQGIDEGEGAVKLYAPVFPGLTYRVATPVADYVSAFKQQLTDADVGSVAFSCNCILNYLYSELEGKKTEHFVGPVTFGEVAYQLLNQTMVYLTITSLN